MARRPLLDASQRNVRRGFLRLPPRRFSIHQLLAFHVLLALVWIIFAVIILHELPHAMIAMVVQLLACCTMTYAMASTSLRLMRYSLPSLPTRYLRWAGVGFVVSGIVLVSVLVSNRWLNWGPFGWLFSASLAIGRGDMSRLPSVLACSLAMLAWGVCVAWDARRWANRRAMVHSRRLRQRRPSIRTRAIEPSFDVCGAIEQQLRRRQGRGVVELFRLHDVAMLHSVGIVGAVLVCQVVLLATLRICRSLTGEGNYFPHNGRGFVTVITAPLIVVFSLELMALFRPRLPLASRPLSTHAYWRHVQWEGLRRLLTQLLFALPTIGLACYGATELARWPAEILDAMPSIDAVIGWHAMAHAVLLMGLARSWIVLADLRDAVEQLLPHWMKESSQLLVLLLPVVLTVPLVPFWEHPFWYVGVAVVYAISGWAIWQVSRWRENVTNP